MAAEPLTYEAVMDLIAEQKTRGQYIKDAKAFFESGELYVDLSAMYPKHQPTSLKTSFDQNIKKIEGHPAYQFAFQKNGDDSKHLILINMDVYQLLQQQNEA